MEPLPSLKELDPIDREPVAPQEWTAGPRISKNGRTTTRVSTDGRRRRMFADG